MWRCGHFARKRRCKEQKMRTTRENIGQIRKKPKRNDMRALWDIEGSSMISLKLISLLLLSTVRVILNLFKTFITKLSLFAPLIFSTWLACCFNLSKLKIWSFQIVNKVLQQKHANLDIKSFSDENNNLVVYCNYKCKFKQKLFKAPIKWDSICVNMTTSGRSLLIL